MAEFGTLVIAGSQTLRKRMQDRLGWWRTKKTDLSRQAVADSQRPLSYSPFAGQEAFDKSQLTVIHIGSGYLRPHDVKSARMNHKPLTIERNLWVRCRVLTRPVAVVPRVAAGFSDTKPGKCFIGIKNHCTGSWTSRSQCPKKTGGDSARLS
jgi:hypothetical protein